MTGYETVIGLEVHAQLQTKTKLFCGCQTEYGAAPNTNVCPVCLGYPGALPVLNENAVTLALRAGHAVGCTLNENSQFSRKNYFYPDLAKGYQTSQFDKPICGPGVVTIWANDIQREITVERIHMEEDAAKNIHSESAHSLIDFNRAGVPLIEIVSAPDLRSGEEAEAYLKVLREILMFVGVNDGNLEEGSFRCDANVSVRLQGDTKLGTRTELKNINSFRFVRMAIEAEAKRQVALLEEGGSVIQETRSYDEASGRTKTMRTKEDAHDYRYFPDPDLPPLRTRSAFVDQVLSSMPATAEQTRSRWITSYGFTDYDAKVLSGHPQLAAFVNAVLDALDDPAEGKSAANLIQAEILSAVETRGLTAHLPVSALQVSQVLAMMKSGVINGKIAKRVISELSGTKDSAKQVVERLGLAQLTDSDAIEALVRDVVRNNPRQHAMYRDEGKHNLLGFFVGQVMKASKGRANPQQVNLSLKRVLHEIF